MIFGILNPSKISYTNILRIWPAHLSDVATLPGVIQIVIFNTIIHTVFW